MNFENPNVSLEILIFCFSLDVLLSKMNLPEEKGPTCIYFPRTQLFADSSEDFYLFR